MSCQPEGVTPQCEEDHTPSHREVDAIDSHAPALAFMSVECSSTSLQGGAI
jgi:hypothetical protein